VDTDLRHRIYELTKALATKEIDTESPEQQDFYPPPRSLVDAREIKFQVAPTVNESPLKPGIKDLSTAIKEPA